MSEPEEPTTGSLTDAHPWLEDGFLTTREAADILGLEVTAENVRHWCQRGFIRYVKEPISRMYLVCEADVRTLAKDCEGPVNTNTVARVMLRRRVGENPSR